MKIGMTALALTLGALLAPACVPAAECLEGKSCAFDNGVATGEDADAGAAPGVDAPSCTVFGRAHVGLGGEDLAAQADGPPSGDRARAKPYSALLTEYGRVLGGDASPPSLASAGPTFGIAPDRWYFEPMLSAVFVTTAFDVAFEGCSRMTQADPKLATDPDEVGARAVCASWIRRFWSREGTPDQISACVEAAVTTTQETYGRPSADETTRPATPSRRWAYACASVLTATGFLTF